MSYSPHNASILSGLLGDHEVAACFSVEADIAAMVQFEVALASATASAGLIPIESPGFIAAACSGFAPDVEKINAGTARDGVPVPELVAQLRAVVGETHGRHVHFGATSQDVIDSSLAIRLKTVVARLKARLTGISGRLVELDGQFGRNELTGRTRMQAAQPILVADRLKAWRAPLARHVTRIDAIAPRILVLQLGGAVGTRGAYGADAGSVAAEMGRILGLAVPDEAWHSARDNVAEFAALLSTITGSLGKIGEDAALMAQNEIGEIELSGGGGSSVMAHKQNPVRAEVLVALARFNATLLAGMHHSLVHEQERSGAAWTLEWMLLPQMCVAAGASTRIALELLDSVKRLGKPV